MQIQNFNFLIPLSGPATGSDLHLFNRTKRGFPDSSPDGYRTLSGQDAGKSSHINNFKNIEEYQAHAELMIAGAKDPTARNKAITGAYSALFLKKPHLFLWAGMAAFASQQVGYGILLPGQKHKLSLLEELQQSALKDWLIAGNNAVYHDLFPVFLAYLDGGMTAVASLKIAEPIKTGFSLIAQGEEALNRNEFASGNRLIQQGNKILLRYEQETTLQPLVYANHVASWKLLSPALLMRFEISLIPNADKTTLFMDHVPGGNIANFDDRWKWIETSMLPLWESLITNDTENISSDLNILRRRGEKANGAPYDF